MEWDESGRVGSSNEANRIHGFSVIRNEIYLNSSVSFLKSLLTMIGFKRVNSFDLWFKVYYSSNF